MSELPNQPRLLKTLRVSDGVALLIGITIGSGIYATPSLVAGYFSSFAGTFTAWTVVGVFILVGGLIYAELGTRMPETGGEYLYISRCFGPFAGFMFGWAQLFIVRTSPTAGLALIAADYVGFFVELNRTSRIGVALLIIVLLGIFNYVGIRWASLFQKVTTIIKVAGLTLFAVGGLLLLQRVPNLLGTTSDPVKDISAVGNLVGALMLIVFTHTGFDRVGYVAGEMRNPREVIPRSMVYGLLMVIGLYWSVISIYHYALGMEGIVATATPAADVAVLMVGTVGAALISILAVVSATGSMNGTVMSASRVYYAMARDGLFFKWFDYVHPRFRTPTRAIVAHCTWACVILLARGSFTAIAAGMVFAILIFYTLTTLALFKLRREESGDEDVYRIPFYPILPGLYLVGIVGLLVARAIFEWRSSLIDIAFVATGLPVSLYWLKNKSSDKAGD
ncbi:MAG: APC family permease [Rhodothermales bacterium]|nr:APC family permease [Rhodothermales bacterium]